MARTYEGEWQNHQRHSQGTFTYADGRVYEGGWKEGSRHGQGLVYDSDGNILHEWLWDDGGACNTSDNVFIPSTTERGDTLHDKTYEIG